MEPTSNIQEWRAQRPTEHILQLGCGLRVKVRKLGLLDLAAAGHIPLPLAGQVAEMIDKGVSGFDHETLKKSLPVVNAVVKALAVDPRIADKPGDDCIGIEEIPVVDRLGIYGWAQREVAPWRVFPVEEPDSSDGAGRRGAKVRDKAE